VPDTARPKLPPLLLSVFCGDMLLSCFDRDRTERRSGRTDNSVARGL